MFAGGLLRWAGLHATGFYLEIPENTCYLCCSLLLTNHLQFSQLTIAGRRTQPHQIPPLISAKCLSLARSLQHLIFDFVLRSCPLTFIMFDVIYHRSAVKRKLTGMAVKICLKHQAETQQESEYPKVYFKSFVAALLVRTTAKPARSCQQKYFKLPIKMPSGKRIACTGPHLG